MCHVVPSAVSLFTVNECQSLIELSFRGNPHKRVFCFFDLFFFSLANDASRIFMAAGYFALELWWGFGIIWRIAWSALPGTHGRTDFLSLSNAQLKIQ